MGKLKDHQEWLNIKLTGKSPITFCSLKLIYWLHIDNIIPPSHPFRNKIEAEYGIIDWDKLDKLKTHTVANSLSTGHLPTENYMLTNIFMEWELSRIQNATIVEKNHKH